MKSVAKGKGVITEVRNPKEEALNKISHELEEVKKLLQGVISEKLPPSIETSKKIHLITFDEAKFRLNVTDSFLRKLIFEKRIPVIRIGKCLRFDENKLNEWIEENSH